MPSTRVRSTRASAVVMSLLAALAGVPGQAAPRLQAGAGAIGGLGSGDIGAGCTTYGAPASVQALFGSGYGLSLPVGGIAGCGYAGQWNEQVAPGGTASTSAAVGPVLLGNPGFAGSYTGSAAGSAQFTALRAAAGGAYSGGLPGGPTALSDASAMAVFSDTLSLSSPLVEPGSAGFVGYRFQFDGSLLAAGAPASMYFGEGLASLVFQHDGGPVYEAARAYVRRGEVGTATSAGQALAGWSGGTGFVSGGGTVRTLDFLLALPIVFGQDWDFTLGLAVRAYGESSASFLSTARLVGMDVFDAQGRAITDFTLTAASGTDYLAPVDEPAAAWLLLAGLAVVGQLARCRRANAQRPAFFSASFTSTQ